MQVAQCHHKGPSKGKAEGSESERDKEEVGEMHCEAAGGGPDLFVSVCLS